MMNRSQSLTRSQLLSGIGAAGAGALLTACGSDTVARTAGGLLLPAYAGSCGKGRQWKFSWTRDVTKSSNKSYATAWRKQYPSCAWVDVGGMKLDILSNKGGGYNLAEVTFYATAPDGKYYTQTIQFADLISTFSKGKIVKLFEKWYFDVTSSPHAGGKLYRSDNTLVGWGSTNAALTRTTFSSVIPGSGDSQQVVHWHHDWGNHWGSGPDISGECLWAELTFYAALGNLLLDALEMLKLPAEAGEAGSLLSKDMAAVILTYGTAETICGK